MVAFLKTYCYLKTAILSKISPLPSSDSTENQVLDIFFVGFVFVCF
jgi:hypothetical protein